MTYLYITRHGETQWNVEGRFQGRGNSELTQRGCLQAKSLSTVLDRENIELILSSPLKRAMETARLARGQRDIPLITLEALAELSLGNWEGWLLADLEKRDSTNYWNYWNDPFRFVPDGGESFPELIARMERALQEAAGLARGRRALVVTHGMSLMAILHLVTGTDFDQVIAKPVLRQASITKVRVHEDGNYEVEYIGDTGHYSSSELNSLSPFGHREGKK